MDGRGDVLLAKLPDRLTSKIQIREDGCWEWTGCVNWAGYGLARIGSLPTTSPGSRGGAHKVVYEATVGLVPDGLQLDHQCHDPRSCVETPECPHRRCVNPEHLAAVTPRSNTLRSGNRAAVNAQKTACPKGHPLSGQNLYVNPRGQRYCRQCQRARRAARSAA